MDSPCDGAWGTAGAGVSAILTPPSGPNLWYAARLEFLSMNTTTEYEATTGTLEAKSTRNTQMHHQVRFLGDSGAHRKELCHQRVRIGKVSGSHKENGETFHKKELKEWTSVQDI